MSQTLRKAREARGISIREAARALGVSHTQWSRWEAGKQRPSYHRILALRSLFGVPVEAWRNIEGETARAETDSPVDQAAKAAERGS